MSLMAWSTIAWMSALSVVRSATITRPSTAGLPEPDGSADSLGFTVGDADDDGFGEHDGFAVGEPDGVVAGDAVGEPDGVALELASALRT